MFACSKFYYMCFKHLINNTIHMFCFFNIVISIFYIMYYYEHHLFPVGYGHIAPETMWGRIVCIAYAVISIPIFLIFLAKIGEILANLFKITYATICCCGCCRKKEEKEKTAVRLFIKYINKLFLKSNYAYK